MDLKNLHVGPSTAAMVAMLFCFLWPFLTMASVAKRTRSSAPLHAALVALAVIVCAIWVELSNLVVGMAKSGGNRESLIFWAREVFDIAPLALWPLGWIAILSLLRRHRPAIDRTLIALAGLLCAIVIAALNFTTLVAPGVAFFVLARTGAAIALVIALAATARFFLLTRASKNPEAVSVD